MMSLPALCLPPRGLRGLLPLVSVNCLGVPDSKYSHLLLTIPQGAFRIYRAPGSVAFLSCGAALQPILPKSQCWCIDEDNSRFILQIRRPQYWRIELPVTDPQDLFRATLLRDVFDKILLFEKTECPFERSFTVQLPDPPETPVKKKAWTAEGKNLISFPFQPDLSPTAHAPKAISRGERAITISRRSSLVDFESIADDKAQKRYSLGARDSSFQENASDSQVYKDADTPGRLGLTVFQAPSSRDNDVVVRASERTEVNPRASLEHIAQDPRVASVPRFSSTGTDLQQYSEFLTLDSSLNDTEAAYEERRSRPLEGPGLDLSSGQTKDNESYLYDKLYRFEKQEETAGVEPFWKENDSGAGGHGAQMQEFVVGAGSPTIDFPGPAIVETQPQYSLSDQQNNGIFESENSNTEDDPAPFEGSGGVAPVNLARKRISRMLAGRSFTAPPQLTPMASTSTSEKQATAGRVMPPQPQQSPAKGQSPSVSTDSFHSVQSWHSSIAPPLASPCLEAPSMHDFSPETDSAERSGPPSQVNFSSNDTTTPENSMKVFPSSPVVSDSCGSAEPTLRPAQFNMDERYQESIDSESSLGLSRLSTFENRLRVRRRSHGGNLSAGRRALSPPPPAANIFSPSPRQASRSRLAVVRELPTTILQKTFEILLSPPSYLINLILKVAAKIAAGEWRGLVFGFGEAGEQIPVQWDYYSDGEFSELSDSDDYALTTHSSANHDSVPRTNLRHRNRSTRGHHHEGCEVD